MGKIDRTEKIENIRDGLEEMREKLDRFFSKNATNSGRYDKIIEDINEWIPKAEDCLSNSDKYTDEEMNVLDYNFRLIKILEMICDMDW